MRFRAGMILGGAAVLLAVPAAAEDGAASVDADRAIQITPYLWLSGFGGSIQPFAGAPTFRASRSFGELLEDLDAALFLTGYARFNRFVTMADLSTSTSSREGLVPTGNPAAPQLPAEGRLKQTSLTLLGGVRALDQNGVAVDFLGGIRSWWIDARVAVPLAGIAQAPDIDFVDPIAAVRMNVRLGDGWNTIVYGDFGGFGAGSEFTGQIAATVNARIAPSVWVSGGYRHLTVDYREGGTRVNATLSGPLLGLTVTF